MPVVIKAKENEIAKVVLLPGDPLRAQYIAKRFLSKSKLYTYERFMLGYTGFYKGYKISIQTTGMGIPSFAIVAEELNMLNVKSMIRIGTAGAINPDIKATDLVIATTAHISHQLWDHNFNNGGFSASSTYKLSNILYKNAIKKNIKSYMGSVLTSIFLYEENEELLKKYLEYNTLAVEMETYALFAIAAKYNIKAASILTISDTLFEKKGDKLIHKVVWIDKNKLLEGIDNMTELALDTIVENYDYLTKNSE